MATRSTPEKGEDLPNETTGRTERSRTEQDVVDMIQLYLSLGETTAAEEIIQKEHTNLKDSILFNRIAWNHYRHDPGKLTYFKERLEDLGLPAYAAEFDRVHQHRVGPLINSVAYAYHTGDHETMQLRADEVLDQYKNKEIYLLAFMARTIQRKDTHQLLERYRTEQMIGGNVSFMFRWFLRPKLKDYNQGSHLHGISDQNWQVFNEIDMEALYPLMKELDPHDNELDLHWQKYMFINNRYDDIIEGMKHYLPSMDDPLEMLKEFVTDSYRNTRFTARKQNRLGLQLEQLAVTLHQQGKLDAAAMVLENRLNPDNGFIQALPADTNANANRHLATISSLQGNHVRVIKAFDHIQTPILRYGFFEFLSKAVKNFPLYEEFDRVGTEIFEVYQNSSGNDRLLEVQYINAIDNSKEIISHSDYGMRLLEFEYTHKGIPKEEVIHFAMKNAHYRFLIGEDPAHIAGRINKDFSFNPIDSCKHDKDSSFEVHSGKWGARLKHLYNRKVSQEIALYELQILQDGKWLTPVELAKEEQELFDSNRPLFQAQGWDNLLTQKIHFHRFGVHDPIDLDQSECFPRDYIKIYQQQDQFLTERSTLMKATAAPGITVPFILHFFKGNDRHCLKLREYAGIGLHEAAYGIPERAITRQLIQRHLLETVYFQQLSLTDEHGAPISQHEVDYATILSQLVPGNESLRHCGIYLNQCQRLNYRDASLFNAVLHLPEVHKNKPKKIRQEMPHLKRVAANHDFRESADYICRFTETIERTGLQETLVQMDFASMQKRSFILEDFLLAVDNPFLRPSEEEIQDYMATYQHYLEEIAGITIQEPQKQLAIGGFFRQLKNREYLRFMRLDYGGMQQEFTQYYDDRTRDYLDRMGDFTDMPLVDL
ncbi:MAG: hypothetical protein ACQESG_05595 [Nanobdellota archaeon]